MSDRISLYKSPLHRLGEFLVAGLLTLGAVLLWRLVLPGLSPAIAVLPLFAVAILLVQRLGNRLAERHGAPMLTSQDREQRYLSEMLPIPSLRVLNMRAAFARAGLARASWASADRRNRNGRMAG